MGFTQIFVIPIIHSLYVGLFPMVEKQKLALSALSHLIGAYWSITHLECDCDEPKRDNDLRQILLHAIGIYWLIMKTRYNIENPKKEFRK